MILPMAKMRIVGPRARLEEVLRALQDFGLLHLAEAPDIARVTAVRPPSRDRRRRRQLGAMLDDIDAALEAMTLDGGPPVRATGPVPSTPPAVHELAQWARRARRLRRDLERLAAGRARLAEERAMLHGYRELLDAVDPLMRRLAGAKRLVTHAAVVPPSARPAVEQLTASFAGQAGETVILSRPLSGGNLAVLIASPAAEAERLGRLLTEARLPETPLPPELGVSSLTEAVPVMRERLRTLPARERELDDARRRLAREHGDEMRRARAAVHDALRRLDALVRCGETARAFVVDGWLPTADVPRLRDVLRRLAGSAIVAEAVAREDWVGENAPVVLSNPRLFRPFETIVRTMRLPRYGTVDPTPFVAVFFPMLFGLMMGDVGYGVVLGALGIVLHRGARPGSMRRTVAEIMGPCAAFAIIFGVLFGELFGDAGRRWFGMQPVLFDRGEAIIAFLLVAVGLGFVHVLLGLVLGVITRRRQPRHAAGSGVSAVMVILIVIVILALAGVLPAPFFTPALIALLVALPVLVLLEGLIAPIEFLSTLGNILSYARVMALGTASVMLAIVANQMVGAVGGTVVGLLLALMFHLVNFGLALFSPTIHALRLHYVEFFGKFYSPGGRPYEPLSHWRPPPALTH